MTLSLTRLKGITNLRVKCRTAREGCPTYRQALGTIYQSLQEKRHAILHGSCEEVREESSAGSPGARSAPGVSANGGACRRRARPRHAPSRDRKSRVRQQISRGAIRAQPPWTGRRFKKTAFKNGLASSGAERAPGTHGRCAKALRTAPTSATATLSC